MALLIYLAAVLSPLSEHGFYFYTTYCGLSVLEAGSIFAIARVIDAVLSPIMGYITDNFGDTWLGRRFGRRRFFYYSVLL